MMACMCVPRKGSGEKPIGVMSIRSVYTIYILWVFFIDFLELMPISWCFSSQIWAFSPAV